MVSSQATGTIEERRLIALRVGIAAGAGIAATLVFTSMGGASPDAFAWFFVALIAAAGGLVGSAVVLAFVHVRRSPVALLKAIAFLSVVSVFFLAPYGVDAFRAHSFLARADSAQGVVTRTLIRGGEHFWVSYGAGNSPRVVRDWAPVGTLDLKVGDTVWVFVDRTDPERAMIGRPGPDWTSALHSLVPLWAIGGVLFLGYGVNATPAGLPQAWRSPVRLLRAYLGAAAMADVGFALLSVLQSDLHNPRREVVSEFESALAFGGVFSLIFTFVLGGIAFLVLQERRRTSASAYAGAGILFGSLSLLIAGPAGLLIGSVSGLFAGLAFRWLYFWGGEPLKSPAATV